MRLEDMLQFHLNLNREDEDLTQQPCPVIKIESPYGALLFNTLDESYVYVIAESKTEKETEKEKSRNPVCK
jgi:hypothetical protein